EGTAADTSLMIIAGAGQNTVNLSPTAQFLDGLQGPVTINGGTGRSGATTLNVFDQNDPFGGDTYTVTNQSVTRTAAALITFTNVPNLTINGSSTVGIIYNVNSNAFGVTTTINAGAANDVFNLAQASHFMDDVQGTLNLNGGGGTNTLTLFDQNDPFSD